MSEAIITAAQLRKMGVPIRDSVPDCAWILATSLVPDPDSVRVDNNGRMSYRCIFTKPLQWLEFEVVFEGIK